MKVRLLLALIFFLSYNAIQAQNFKSIYQNDEEKTLIKHNKTFLEKQDAYNISVDHLEGLSANEFIEHIDASQLSKKLTLQMEDIHNKATRLRERIINRYEKEVQNLVTQDQMEKQLIILHDSLSTLYPFQERERFVKQSVDRFRNTPEFVTNGDLISHRSYSKKVARSFSYLILGDNSPQQGVSAVINEEGTSIKLNGVLHQGQKWITTVEADLKATDGVYFFDDERGGTQAKITFNVFRNFYAPTNFETKKKSITKKMLQDSIQNLIETSYSDFEHLHEMLSISETDIQQAKDFKEVREEVLWEIKKLTAYYINPQDSLGVYRLRKLPFDEKPYLVKGGTSEVQQYDISKVRASFLSKALYMAKTLEKKITALELEQSKQLWTLERSLFGGLSGFYQRESFKRFSFQENVAFDKLFASEKGDLFGLTLSLNYSLNKTENYPNIRLRRLVPQRIFLRGFASVSRASNFSSFTTAPITFQNVLGIDVSGNEISASSSDTAFIGDTAYEFGNSIKLGFEAYYYPLDAPIGLFGMIGYEYVNFSSKKEADDKELSPMRLGLIFNIKNKEKDKPLVVLQAFLDRTDLSLSPNRKDDDLRFGFGVGLPINLK